MASHATGRWTSRIVRAEAAQARPPLTLRSEGITLPGMGAELIRKEADARWRRGLSRAHGILRVLRARIDSLAARRAGSAEETGFLCSDQASHASGPETSVRMNLSSAGS